MSCNDNNHDPWITKFTKEIMMKRLSVLIYGFTSYAIFFATFLYAIGFVGNIFVPKGIDSIPNVPMTQALLINLGLLGVFAIQHSVMARPVFKRWITKFIPQAIERSTYTLFSSLALIALFAFWEPMGGLVWKLESPVAIGLMYAGFGFGWLLVLVCTFLINHFDLFGLRQVWLNFRNQAYTPLKFKLPMAYRIVRHPMYVGWFFAFWCTPTMTVAHLAFALATSAYILIAIQLEERDLMEMHPEYCQYRKRVPMIVPFTGKRTRKSDQVEGLGAEV
jgi:protein-S-isoprenylcysteine O-methyltransferase Ste14